MAKERKVIADRVREIVAAVEAWDAEEYPDQADDE